MIGLFERQNTTNLNGTPSRNDNHLTGKGPPTRNNSREKGKRKGSPLFGPNKCISRTEKFSINKVNIENGVPPSKLNFDKVDEEEKIGIAGMTDSQSEIRTQELIDLMASLVEESGSVQTSPENKRIQSEFSNPRNEQKDRNDVACKEKAGAGAVVELGVGVELDFETWDLNFEGHETQIIENEEDISEQQMIDFETQNTVEMEDIEDDDIGVLAPEPIVGETGRARTDGEGGVGAGGTVCKQRVNGAVK